MKDLMNSTDTTTMTLKEITDLLDVRHNNAMRTVKKMQEDLSFGMCTQIEYKLLRNNAEFTIQTYQLDKRQSIAVASRLNTALLMKVIDRWQELESDKRPMTEIERAEKNAELALEHVRILKANAQLEKDNTALCITLDKESQWSSIKSRRSCTEPNSTGVH